MARAGVDRIEQDPLRLGHRSNGTALQFADHAVTVPQILVADGEVGGRKARSDAQTLRGRVGKLDDMLGKWNVSGGPFVDADPDELTIQTEEALTDESGPPAYLRNWRRTRCG